MLKLEGLEVVVKDLNGQGWLLYYYQPREKEKISFKALKEVKALKEKGWKLAEVCEYWAD